MTVFGLLYIITLVHGRRWLALTQLLGSPTYQDFYGIYTLLWQRQDGCEKFLHQAPFYGSTTIDIRLEIMGSNDDVLPTIKH